MFPLIFKIMVVFLERRRLRRLAVISAMIVSRVARSERGRRAVAHVSRMVAARVRRRWSTRRRKRSWSSARPGRLRAKA